MYVGSITECSPKKQKGFDASASTSADASKRVGVFTIYKILFIYIYVCVCVCVCCLFVGLDNDDRYIKIKNLSEVMYDRLRVTCDDMHLHYVEPHQFIDSPEWEANHDNSDDVFQV